MTKQISSSFLLISSINVTELEIIGWKSFTVYVKHIHGWILFCTKQNCHAYKYKVTSNVRDKAETGTWARITESACLAPILPCLQGDML